MTLACEDHGAGTPVVLLHGAGLTRRLWDPQVEHLRGRYRCIAADLRGHGASPGSGGPVYTVGDHASDVLALMDAVRVGRAHLAGLSLGGMVAMQIALDAPQRVASVVTIGAPAQIAGNAVVNASLAALTWWMFRHDVAWMLDKGARQMRCSPAAKRYLLENGASMDKDELRRVWAGVVAFGVRSRLSEMQPPVLVIAGSRDANFRRARSAAAQMPNARFACIEGAGHITNRDAPARVNALIDEWLEREARDEVVRPDRQTDSHG